MGKLTGGENYKCLVTWFLFFFFWWAVDLYGPHMALLKYTVGGGAGEGLRHDFYLHRPINRFPHSPGSVFYFVASLVLSSSIMFSEAA